MGQRGLDVDFVVVRHRSDGPVEGILLLLAPSFEESNVVPESGHPHRQCSQLVTLLVAVFHPACPSRRTVPQGHSLSNTEPCQPRDNQYEMRQQVAIDQQMAVFPTLATSLYHKGILKPQKSLRH